ncbi:hydroxyacid dehydrogenase, partial [Bacillus sp. D-CC]
MAKILVAGKIPEIGLELLKDHDVEINSSLSYIST